MCDDGRSRAFSNGGHLLVWLTDSMMLQSILMVGSACGESSHGAEAWHSLNIIIWNGGGSGNGLVHHTCGS